MKKINKSIGAYKTISEVIRILNLKSKQGKSLPAHTLRYWEREFKQIKPKKLNGKRRYCDEKSIKIIKKIYYLLKDQGMTINGAKKILNDKDPLKLDEISNRSINTADLKNKIVKISKIIKNLKNFK